MRVPFMFVAATSMLAITAPALAQTTSSTGPKEVIGSILGTLFGNRVAAGTSLEEQWSAGKTPLLTQQPQFETRVDTEVRSGNLTTATATRLRSDYAALVELETRYAADGWITSQERAELSNRYGALTQVLSDRGYADSAVTVMPEVSSGQAEFGRRVDAAVKSRKITRTAGTRLKNDYAALVTTETAYLRDGVISSQERDDLDQRLDAFELRLGEASRTSVTVTPRTRLDSMARTLTTSSLNRTAKVQLLREIGDLTRLADAYARSKATAEEQSYLERRLGEVEVRIRKGN